jgi:hypothetical protein
MLVSMHGCISGQPCTFLAGDGVVVMADTSGTHGFATDIHTYALGVHSICTLSFPQQAALENPLLHPGRQAPTA